MALLSACVAADQPEVDTVAPRASTDAGVGADYSFELSQTCGNQPVTGRFLVTVENGDVADAVGLDRASRASGAEQYIPTLESLSDAIAEANARPGGSARATYDDATGELATVDIDLGPGVDDESCYVITDVRR